MPSIEERMAVIETTIDTLEFEMGRARDRIHALETLTAAVGLVAQRVDSMAKHMSEVSDEMSSLRKALIGGAVTVAGSMTIFALTIFLVFR